MGLAVGAKDIIEIFDAALYDTSSRTRSPYVGEVLVWQNTAGYYLATKVIAIELRGQNGGGFDALTVEYQIASNKSATFAL